MKIQFNKINYTLYSICIITIGYLCHKYAEIIFYAINGFYPTLFKYPFLLLSSICDGMVALIVICLLSRVKSQVFTIACFSLVILGAIVYLIKTSGYSPKRPLHVLDNVVVYGYHLTNATFPSGHATTAGVLIGSSFFIIHQRLYRIWLIVLGLFMACARVYIGVHWPLDIWVGFFMGLFFTIDIQKHSIFQKEFVFIHYVTPLIMMGAAIIYLLFHDVRKKEIDLIMQPTMYIVILYATYLLYKQIINYKTRL